MSPFRPRRSLGQSFLVHIPTANRLVSALDVGVDDTVLEVGPGKGILTRRLLERAKRVIAVEIDERLVKTLSSKLGDRPELELVHGDFLHFELGTLGPTAPGGKKGELKVIGNLPYNVSSQIVYRLLNHNSVWTRAVLTTQREFAQRVLAGPGSKAYGPLSVFLERVVAREKLFNIPAARFRPRPDVVSTSFRLARREKPLFPLADEEGFRRTVKAAFAQRRKTLANNLCAELGLDREGLLEVLKRCGIDDRARGEAVGISGFRRLHRALAGRTGQGPD